MAKYDINKNSNQEMATPPEFVRAVEKYFKIKFKYDMAATPDNTKCKNYFTATDDSLKFDWPLDGWCWLNPPFRNLTAWIKKCKEQKDRGCKTITVWPLSGDKNQVVTWASADIYIIHGRIWPHVRGIMLCKWTKNKPRIVSGLIWNGVKLIKKWYMKSNKKIWQTPSPIITATSPAQAAAFFGPGSLLKKVAQILRFCRILVLSRTRPGAI